MPPPILFQLRQPIQNANALGVGPFMRALTPQGIGSYLTIYGVSKNSSGAVLGSCVIDLFRSVDDVKVDTVVSDPITGAYEFRGVSPSFTHYLVAYKAGAPDVAGTTINTLVGSTPVSDVVAKSYVAEVLTDSPIWWGRLAEPSGTVVIDEIGTLDGSYVNTPTLAQPGPLIGATSYGVTLNGTDEYITVPDDPVIDQGNGPLSWEIWFKKASSASGATQELMAKGQFAPTLQLYNGGAGDHYCEWYNLLDATPSVHSLTRFGDTTWHHLVGTHNVANVWLIYADGVEVSVLEAAGPASSNTASPLEIGRRHDSSRYFNGTVAEPALYGSILSPERVAAHYRAAGY